MASPESVKMGSPVAPAEPEEVFEADVADPGVVEELKQQQRESQSGKYGSVEVEPITPPEEEEEAAEEEQELTWIEIELVDENDEPVVGEIYRVTSSDGRVKSGTLDHNGYAKVWYLTPGSCTVTFPRLDQDAWEKI